jgi:hypothetical protein
VEAIRRPWGTNAWSSARNGGGAGKLATRSSEAPRRAAPSAPGSAAKRFMALPSAATSTATGSGAPASSPVSLSLACAKYRIEFRRSAFSDLNASTNASRASTAAASRACRSAMSAAAAPPAKPAVAARRSAVARRRPPTASTKGS